MEKKRNSIRLRNYDYTSGGVYFVTICTHEREHLFGEIQDGQMVLNEFGHIADRCWKAIPEHLPHAELDLHVVMPNHIHGILFLNVGARHASPSPSPMLTATATRPDVVQGIRKAVAGSLGSVLGSFKSAATREINLKRSTPAFPVWQRNYFERVIRDDQELILTREYVNTNPQKWDLDEENL